MSAMWNGWQNNSLVNREAETRRMPNVQQAGDEATAVARGDEVMSKLLLIEDDKETADEIRAELGYQGFEVDWAANGIDGLDKARAGGAEVMIIDRMLPGMDGLTIIEALRR